MKQVYFDNAATSWPKPPKVMRAMQCFFLQGGGNPGRSGHRKAIEAGRTVLRTRELLAELFNIRDPSRIVFTKNATEALNLAFYGLLHQGDRVLTTSMEHNSVMRPLGDLAQRGVRLEVAEADRNGVVDPDDICRRVNGDTRLVAVTHASNVTGSITDLQPIGERCRKLSVPLLVDAAQTAGCVPIDVDMIGIDYLAFSGHKGLLGPQGTGGLYIRDEKALEPLMRGGTGSFSDKEEQPQFLPDRYESGTLNVPGIAGLGAGVEHILSKGVESIMEHDRRLLELFLHGISSEKRIRTYGPGDPQRQTAVLSLNLENLSASEAGERLESRFGILTRIGLHCAPRAHKTIGTFPAGTVRFSWGVFTRERDVLHAVRALKAILDGRE